MASTFLFRKAISVSCFLSNQRLCTGPVHARSSFRLYPSDRASAMVAELGTLGNSNLFGNIPKD